MFSGIVEAIGIIRLLTMGQDCLHLTIEPQIAFDDLKMGDSVAINGVCLTVTSLSAGQFAVTVVPETLRLTNLHQLTVDSMVNLERSIQANARMGGHYVQGHVDCVGEVTQVQPDGKAALLLTIQVPQKWVKYIVPKGYIGVDGMSLTVIDVGADWFTLTLIPHTQQATIAKHYQAGSKLNIEVDILGKYVEKLVGGAAYAAIRPSC